MPKKEYHLKGDCHVRKGIVVNNLEDLGTNVRFFQIRWHRAMGFTGFEICPPKFYTVT